MPIDQLPGAYTSRRKPMRDGNGKPIGFDPNADAGLGFADQDQSGLGGGAADPETAAAIAALASSSAGVPSRSQFLEAEQQRQMDADVTRSEAEQNAIAARRQQGIAAGMTPAQLDQRDAGIRPTSIVDDPTSDPNDAWASLGAPTDNGGDPASSYPPSMGPSSMSATLPDGTVINGTPTSGPKMGQHRVAHSWDPTIDASYIEAKDQGLLLPGSDPGDFNLTPQQQYNLHEMTQAKQALAMQKQARADNQQMFAKELDAERGMSQDQIAGRQQLVQMELSDPARVQSLQQQGTLFGQQARVSGAQADLAEAQTKARTQAFTGGGAGIMSPEAVMKLAPDEQKAYYDEIDNSGNPQRASAAVRAVQQTKAKSGFGGQEDAITSDVAALSQRTGFGNKVAKVATLGLGGTPGASDADIQATLAKVPQLAQQEAAATGEPVESIMARMHASISKVATSNAMRRAIATTFGWQ